MAGVYQIYNTDRQLGVDNSGIKYVIKHTQGYMKKLNCTFVLISKEEYINNV